jgi:3-hydroxyacyl-CoA dehydrogenase
MAVRIARDGEVAVVTIDTPPVNAASHAVRQGLADAVRQCDGDPEVRAVVLICAGRSFVAGADVKEFDRPPQPPLLPEVIAAIEGAAKPWIAAIHGTALGGGLELAMGCHARVATAEAKLGLPEVTLGLVPGAGGTVRLPRLVPADLALRMISGGKPIGAAEARTAGLIDVVAEGDLLAEATAMALRPGEPRRTLLLPPRPPADPAAFAAEAERARARARGQVAIAAAVDAVERALSRPASEALALERAAFLRLKSGPQSAALRHIFFAERSTLADPRCAGPSRPVDRIAVIGGGTMGAAIAAACLLSGLTVSMIERDAEAAEAGAQRLAGLLSETAARGLISPAGKADALSRFSARADYAATAEADLVIEAVFEDIEVKKTVFVALDAHARPDAILATNTSYLDVNEIAASLRDPSRVVGLHFFAPAHVMKLLEIVLPDAVADDVVATAAALSKRLGKIGVLSGVCDGFIGNRIMSAYRREADYLVEDGALPWEVDAAMRAFGFPMGVFEMQDLSGLDIAWAMRKRRASSRDPSERYVGIADRLCEAGRLGRKAGAGWYDHADGRPRPSPWVEALIAEERRRKGIVPMTIPAPAIMNRILTTMLAEADKVIAEGIARRPEDVDVVMVNGYGFPRWKGGPFFFAELRRSGRAADGDTA